MKNFLKDLIPPIFLKLYRSYYCQWKGDYKSWQHAMSSCSGYDSDFVINKVAKSALKVSEGFYPYERDSVLFDTISYSWPLSTALSWSALKGKGRLRVLDFGGALGSSFFQNKLFLDSVEDLKWFVVEQDKFVNIGREKIKEPRLFFKNSIKQVIEKEKIDIVLVSGTLQYMEDPKKHIDQILSVGADIILIDRLSIVNRDESIITKQTVPTSIYDASYPCWFFSKKIILNEFLNEYELVSEFDSFISNENTLNYFFKVKDIGFFLKRKQSNEKR